MMFLALFSKANLLLFADGIGTDLRYHYLFHILYSANITVFG